jgi:hypothetical protein
VEAIEKLPGRSSDSDVNTDFRLPKRNAQWLFSKQESRSVNTVAGLFGIHTRFPIIAPVRDRAELNYRCNYITDMRVVKEKPYLYRRSAFPPSR